MSRGGRRCGAGRPALHAKTAQRFGLDVRRLQRGGHLSSRQSLTWPWPGRASMGVETEFDSVRLTYRHKNWQGEWRDVDERILIQRTQCHYGGDRPWFICPRCLRRAAILYMSEAPWCRLCTRLVYRSQAEDGLARSWRRTRKIMAQLGQADGNPSKLPIRPQGMREATYSRLSLDWIREALRRALMIKEFLSPR